MADQKPYGPDYQPTQEGVFNLPDAEYFKIKALSSSVLKEFRKSPAHVKAKMDEEPTSGETAAMREGTGFHWSILQPKLWREKVVAELAINKNKKEYKAWKLAQDASGNLVLPQKKINLIEKAAQNAFSKKSIARQLASGWPERALIWFDVEYGIWMKCKCDWIRSDGRAIIDLKKSESASEFGFQRAIYRYDYYVQAFHYLRGFKHLARLDRSVRVKWFWLVAEVVEPCESNIFLADQNAIEEAGDDVLDYYQRYAECVAKDVWPGYPDRVIELGVEFDPFDDAMAF